MFEGPEHPLYFVSRFLGGMDEVADVELSIYRYEPQSMADDRRIFLVPPKRLAERFHELRRGLTYGEEIAFHSRVHLRTQGRERIMHLPMIDFKGILSHDAITQALQAVGEFGTLSAAVYETGRSCHLYGFQLLHTEDWIKFMARILLLNPPDGHDFVDSRWVGHRLFSGFASLRWTWNTPAYRGHPRRVADVGTQSWLASSWPQR